MKPPPKELAAGKYPSGIVYYGDQGFYPFGLWEDELIQHIGIFGRSGSGKTNLCYMLLEGLVAADKPFLIFDWKQNYRDLIAKQPFSDLDIFTVGRSIRLAAKSDALSCRSCLADREAGTSSAYARSSATAVQRNSSVRQPLEVAESFIAPRWC